MLFKKLILCFTMGLVITLGIILVTDAASPREAQSASAQALQVLSYQTPQYLEDDANGIMQGNKRGKGDGILYFLYTDTNKAAAITNYLSKSGYYPPSKVKMGTSCEPRDGQIYCVLVFENIDKTCTAEMRHSQIKECQEWMRDRTKKAPKYN
ncbi:hypothetical protein AB4Z45_27770 [Paenibacillus sp. MCAF9]|uniref:hypothetical protein n=1 Tax=Paenibacillus sp. MCAF9 TaxID=3233046 RepID=UPI003F94FA37